jgi:hypothetical protein
MRALVSGHISMRRAGLILYCLQTAAANLKAYNAQLAADAELATADPHPIAPLLAVTPPPTAERQDGEPLKDAPAPPHARIPASVPQRDDVVHKIAAHAAREHAPVPAAAHSG